MKNLSKEFWRIFGKVNIFERQFYGGIKPDGEPWTEEDRYQAFVDRMVNEGYVTTSNNGTESKP